MSEVSLWLQRKFKFDFPADLHPDLRVRLRGTPARLEELTRDVNDEQLKSRLDGKWSIQENAGHLLDLEELWITRLNDFLEGKEILTASEITNAKTHQARHNDRSLGDILSAFRRSRWDWLDRLHGLGEEDFCRSALHPRLQLPMRLIDSLFFVAEHDDHHLARVWEIRKGFMP